MFENGRKKGSESGRIDMDGTESDHGVRDRLMNSRLVALQ